MKKDKPHVIIPPWSVIFHTSDEFYLTPDTQNRIAHIVKPYISTTCRLENQIRQIIDQYKHGDNAHEHRNTEKLMNHTNLFLTYLKD